MGRWSPTYPITATSPASVRRPIVGVLLFLVLAQSCSRKAEILPQDARHVTRSDSVVNSGGSSYELRSYTFQLQLPEGKASFVCETKKFVSEADALAAALKSIAERSDEQQKKNSAWYARAGLSQWLLTGRTLTWCMYASRGSVLGDAALSKLRKEFLARLEKT